MNFLNKLILRETVGDLREILAEATDDELKEFLFASPEWRNANHKLSALLSYYIATGKKTDPVYQRVARILDEHITPQYEIMVLEREIVWRTETHERLIESWKNDPNLDQTKLGPAIEKMTTLHNKTIETIRSEIKELTEGKK